MVKLTRSEISSNYTEALQLNVIKRIMIRKKIRKR